MSNFELGLLLMVVGMTTVFAILLIIIGMGKGLILLVNKYAPEEVKSMPSHHRPPVPDVNKDGLPPAATAAIVSAVSALTGGQGKVIKIEKHS